MAEKPDQVRIDGSLVIHRSMIDPPNRPLLSTAAALIPYDLVVGIPYYSTAVEEVEGDKRIPHHVEIGELV